MTTLTDDEVFQQWGLGSLVRNRQASRLLRPAPDPKFGTEGEAWIKMWKALSTQRIPSSSITAQGGRPSRQAQVEIFCVPQVRHIELSGLVQNLGHFGQAEGHMAPVDD